MLLLSHLGPLCIDLKVLRLVSERRAGQLRKHVARESHAQTIWLTPNIRGRGSGEVEQPECGSRSLKPEDRHFFGL